MDITMKEVLKSRGWTLEMMAEKMNCSISQISKIQNGVVPITTNMQSKFQEVFPSFTLVNGVEKWKEKYQELQRKYLKLLVQANAMKEELEDHRIIFAKLGNTLSNIGNDCSLNSENISKYEICSLNKKSRKILN